MIERWKKYHRCFEGFDKSDRIYYKGKIALTYKKKENVGNVERAVRIHDQDHSFQKLFKLHLPYVNFIASYFLFCSSQIFSLFFLLKIPGVVWNKWFIKKHT